MSRWRKLALPELVLAAYVWLSFVCICAVTANCSGRKVLNGDEGHISDGPNNYLANSHCEWLIEAGNPNKTIHLQFRKMSTECSFDFLFVYDGDCYRSPLLATLSGDSLPYHVTARSGHMLLYLYSDRNYLKEGFEARYVIYDCPWNCSNRGVCINHTCRCQSDYHGDACQHQSCADASSCSNAGACTPVSKTVRRCKCNSGYVGPSCNISLNSGSSGTGSDRFQVLLPPGSGFKARTSHTAVFFDETDCLWVFGGFDLNSVLDDLSRYCFSSQQWESLSKRAPWPSARSGHAMAAYKEGFFIFGGVQADGRHSGELWYFNASAETERWELKASNSTLSPGAVTGHTLTTVGDYLYLIGGKTEERISRDDVYRISAESPEEWERVVIKGSRYPPKRLVGHSTIYHKESHSLIVFGGYIQSSVLFSDRHRQLFSLSLVDLYWTELVNSNWRAATIPKERAFHSAVRIGNYMVVFGGNTHDHSGLEICYNPRMYFYHLGCHVWLNHTYFTGQLTPKGRFGHAAVVARGNLMVVVGGYSGQVLDDLLLYRVPSAVATPQTGSVVDHCNFYRKLVHCIDDPECIYCTKGSKLPNEKGADLTVLCIHRNSSRHCVEGEFQDTYDRCPGICPALHTCGACVSHGRGVLAADPSPRQQVHISQCSWCVKEARCQKRSEPLGTCKAANQTVSGKMGWWGGLSRSLTTLLQCQHEDFPAGLHWIKYRNPMNYSYPDELSIKRTSSGTLGYVSTPKIESLFYYTARFVGFIHPLNATPPDGERLRLSLGLTHAVGRLYLSSDETENMQEKVISMVTSEMYDTTYADRRANQSLFPNVTRGSKYYINQVTEQAPKSFSKDMEMSYTSQVVISWNAHLGKHSLMQEISSEFLEPYGHGSCAKHFNCLGCLMDVLCSWCEVTRSCVLRSTTNLTCSSVEEANAANETGQLLLLDEEYYITSPSECPNCGNYVQCHTCVEDVLCEWVPKNGHCTRRGRGEDNIREVSDCHPACHSRLNCSDCISETGQCVWCENTRTCLPFSDYVTRYIYGQCTSWVDTVTMGHGCIDCRAYNDCKTCLGTFGCGWCSNADNPSIGVCIDGDFTGPSRGECSTAMTERYNIYADESTSWAYSRCPDVNECRLGLYNCHRNATCINTIDGYECRCNQGFLGNGRDHCEKTCFHSCVYGRCSEAPDHVCVCDLGWTSPWCNESCGCNNHSTCPKGVGSCEQCQHHTTGEHCQLCVPGSYGEPSDPQGCRLCDCNSHGDPSKGECHEKTGDCFCIHNTQGPRCDACKDGYYGNPRNGGRCYMQCDDRSINIGITEGGLGSYRGTGTRDLSHTYCLWVLTVHSSHQFGLKPDEATRIITFTVEGDMRIECGQDAVHVYDGVPAHINGSYVSTARHIGSICGLNPGRDITVFAYSGTLMVLFEANLLSSKTHGFNATYKTELCQGQCRTEEVWDAWKCVGGRCVCEAGFFGPHCKTKICPNNCFANSSQGSCDMVHGICRCKPHYAGADCSINIGANPHVELLIDPDRHSDGVPAPSPRVGHTMVSCGDHKLYVFGGFSLQRGLLNDMWRYDTQTGEWEELEPNLLLPRGRYYHAAACIPGRLQIFVYGGFLEPYNVEIQVGDPKKPQPTSELWIFNIGSGVWSRPTIPPWMPELVGHTLTYVGNHKLVMIGGFAAELYFSNTLYEYNAESSLITWQDFSHEKMTGSYPIGVYGHSAVYHHRTNTIYVYGGYTFRSGRWFVSHNIYTLDLDGKREWNLLMIQSPEFPPLDPIMLKSQDKEPVLWDSRVFHTAVGTDNEMIIIGGLMSDGSYANDLLVYRYYCNTWHRIQFAQFDMEQKTISAMGVKAVMDGGHIYMFGGFLGDTMATLSRLTLPEDICGVFSYSECMVTMGCHVCGNATSGVCYTAGKESGRPENCHLQDAMERQKHCSKEWYLKQNCSRFKTCSQCLSKYPPFKYLEQKCQWCTSCPKAACIAMATTCPRDKECGIEQHIIQHPGACYEYSCAATDCRMCQGLNKCLWTRHFKQSSESGRFYNKDPVYNWNCVTRSLRPMTATSFVGYPPGECPRRCIQHRNCSDCLQSNGVEGGSQMCMWSETLRECMAPAYLPLRCLYGECGYVHLGGQSESTCPVPCHARTQCAACITTPGCGWCEMWGNNGQGLCMRGGLSGPLGPGRCGEKGISSDLGHQPDDFEFVPPNWAYDRCPTENECTNGHHTCDQETQDCYDTITSYRCECKRGYIKNANGKCEPICHQGCYQGTCIRPDVCKCHFGIVGDNCSDECQCHKNSNCVSVAKRDECIKCENFTVGKTCDMCQQYFVGYPKNGEPCIPCRQFCNNHTDVCVSRDEYELGQINLHGVKYSHRTESQSQEKHGPRYNEALCINCNHNTTGPKCSECLDGHFRKPGEPKTLGCIPCQCNGHSNKCNRDTGESCACHNNTETRCDAKDDVPCWQKQCAHCKEYFQGTPTDGHQCYRQMVVDMEYCLDPNSQNECLHNPVALLPGRTVFYAVQPKYLNVDIRITIDITQGSADVFFSNREDMFQVFTNPSNGVHMVNIDPSVYQVDMKIRPPVDVYSRQRQAMEATGAEEFVLEHVTASSLNTYITVLNKLPVLVVRNVQFRLVITLPENHHNLRVSRFYIIIQSRESTQVDEGEKEKELMTEEGAKTYGNLYFRQDQPHIDLFVFFSVFFSCFFLFLALCVMLWKVKQAFDARRSRQMREREMECMASRPFAKVLVLLETEDAVGSREVLVDTFSFGVGLGLGCNTFVSSIYHRRGRLSRPVIRLYPQHNNPHPPLLTPLDLSPAHLHAPPTLSPPSRPSPSLGVVPIAVEPTEDGVAAVGTVLFQLPGASQAPSRLCIGSTLTLKVMPPHQAHKFVQRRRPSASPC